MVSGVLSFFYLEISCEFFGGGEVWREEVFVFKSLGWGRVVCWRFVFRGKGRVLGFRF